MALTDVVFVFFVSLVIGTIAILVGVWLIVDRDAGVTSATFTALLGAAIWAASSAVLEWIPGLEWLPIVGGALMLVVWIGAINWHYPGGLGDAVAIGFVAWIVAVAVIYALAFAGYVDPDALGLSGV